ncbi:hypothetical protein VUJ46_19030 [Chryseobacterium sp. MYb264]|uniref:hypothetical protein n=1 Tax=Chryseobacterium sp. MYb264 TaxID=2745153 RepID=UPI002E112BF1|nr:hypothetical protein VUJ46_19030 [Chryseobacterium sp. MYb264]
MSRLKQYLEFNREIKRLISLYNASLYCFPNQGKQIKKSINEGEIEPMQKIYLNGIEEDKFFLAGNAHELANKLRSGFSKNLREITLIRAISALEVLLIELIREIFLHKKYLFHTGQKIEFSYGELLASDSISNIWSKVVNKECRKLQNQGFKEITKYYRNSFLIDFNSSKTSTFKIQYIHDIRHLLVHRLGKTDAHFRHTYNSQNKTIVLSEDFFYESLLDIINFGKFVSFSVDKLIASPNSFKIGNKNDTISTIEVKILDELSEKIFQSDFSFISGENFHLLGDIVNKIEKDDAELKINLCGPKLVVRDYIKILKVYQKNQQIEILSKTIKTKEKITQDDIDKIRSNVNKFDLTEDELLDLEKKVGIKKNMIKRILSELKLEIQNHS